MNLPIELDSYAKLGAIEIHDVSRDDVLSTELEPEAAPIAQQGPGSPFGAGRLLTHFPGERPEKARE